MKDKQYLENLRESLFKIDKQGTTICLGGDFNLGDINWESNSFKPGGKYPTLCKQRLDIADEFSLHQLVNEPTRKDRILDLFFTSNSSLVNQVMVTPGISDHDGIPLVDMSTKPKLGQQKPRKIFLYNKADTKKLKHDLKNMCERITSDTNSSKSVEELWLQFRDGIKGVFINTLVGGGWAKWRGGQKSFEFPEGGGTKKFSRSKRGGQKSLAKLKIKMHNLLLKLTGYSLKLYLYFKIFPGPSAGPALYLIYVK